jgi:hypothetical protein
VEGKGEGTQRTYATLVTPVTTKGRDHFALLLFFVDMGVLGRLCWTGIGNAYTFYAFSRS